MITRSGQDGTRVQSVGEMSAAILGRVPATFLSS